MKTVTFYAKDNNRRKGDKPNLLRIQTDGCIVNIHCGLRDSSFRECVAVEIKAAEQYHIEKDEVLNKTLVFKKAGTIPHKPGQSS